MPVSREMRVLMVDDQLTMRQLMRYCLEQLGIRNIVDAKDGAEALEAMQSNRFDLIISDWNMAPVDGLQLLKAIRNNPLTKKTPFIMSTANADRGRVKEAVQAGVNNYVVKPFNVETLRKKVEQVVGPLT